MQNAFKNSALGAAAAPETLPAAPAPSIVPAPNFAPADLQWLPKFANYKTPERFEGVAIGLIRFAQEPGQFGYGDVVGHFEYCDFEQSALENRALLRMCRAALDYLDAEETACNIANVVELRASIAGFEAARGVAPAPAFVGASVSPIGPPTNETEAAAESDGEPTSYLEYAEALRQLATFAEAAHENRLCDYTSEISETREICEALRLGRLGVGYLSAEFSEELARATEWRRRDIEAFAALEIETPGAE